MGIEWDRWTWPYDLLAVGPINPKKNLKSHHGVWFEIKIRWNMKWKGNMNYVS